MLFGIPLIHGIQYGLGSLYGANRAFGQYVQMFVRNHGRDFNNDIIKRIQTRHFQIGPDQVLGVSRHGVSFSLKWYDRCIL